MSELSKQENIIFGTQDSVRKHNIFFSVIFLLWTTVAALFLYWSLQQMDERILESARIQARTSIEKDVVYRRWNAMHGGLYGPATDNLPSNKYLPPIGRDIVSRDGLEFTKVNPAYMTRQVHDLGELTSGIVGHITSLNPIRPENKADIWETKVLTQIENDPGERSAVLLIDGKKYLRLMAPLVTEAGCLKCHAEQGYKVGDIRGGISVSVPLAPLFAGDRNGRNVLVAVNILAWLLGALVIRSFARIKKSNMKVRASEKKYRTLVETMSDGIVIIDCHSNVTFCNPQFANMLGYDPDELCNTSLSIYLDDESSGEYYRKVEEITHGKLEPFELNFLKRTGGQVTVLFSPRILRDMSCESRGLLAVITDISSLKKMEKEMLRQQRLISVGMLAGGVAHEIGTPLQYLKVNSQFLRRAFEAFNEFMIVHKSDLGKIEAESETVLESKLRQHDIERTVQEVPAVLDENENSIMRIADITESIKELAGTGPVQPEPEDINTLIRQCVEMTRSSWSGIAEMDVDLSKDISTINCISRDINQVLITIIMNAVDSISLMRESSEDAQKGIIRIATGRLGGELRIVISDNGVGIGRDDIDKIFEPFFTTKKPGKGTGQGLAVAMRIMSEHHGDIFVESLSRKGAVFILSLPLDI